MMNINRVHQRGAIAAARWWISDWGGWLTVALSILFLNYFVWIVFFNPAEEMKTLVTDFAQPIVSLGMTILARRASRQPTLSPRVRRAWQILTIAFLIYAVANIIWAFYELLVKEDLSVTLTDIAYLLYYPICLIGLLTFPMGRAGRSRLTFALDAGTVMLGGAVIIWYLIMRPVALAQHASSLETVIALAYPVESMVLLFGVIAVLLRRPPRNVSRALGILSLAIFVGVIADFGYSYQALDNSYFGGQWPDCFYMLGFVLMGISAQHQFRSSGRDLIESPGVEKSPFSWLPYLAVAASFSLTLYITYQHEWNHGLESVALLSTGAFLLTALVVIRQIVALRENSRLLAEKAARESEARFVSLVQNASDVIAVISSSAELVYVSPSVERVFGYRPMEVAGRHLQDFLFPDDRERVLNTLEAVAAVSGRTSSIELRARHQDGRWLNVESVMTNLLTEPNVNGIVVNSRDITERKKAEEALHDSEERLRHAQKMEAVGQLAGGVAHDFNNLLAVIIGYADLLLQRTLPEGNERAVKHIEEIKKAGDRAKSLTRQLLAFSRKQVLQPKVLDLNAVVKDMDKMLRRLIGEHIEMRAVLEAELWSVKADPGQIEQVLLNLAVNARDAMLGGGNLTIETRNVELDGGFSQKHKPVEPGSYVMIAVSDSGCGMTPEVQSRIFEPFFTTKETGKGTGLGLSTVYGIVKQSGGSIWCYSEPGRGTTFKIYFPRAREVAGAIEPTEVKTKNLSGTETILIVEDEDAVRQLAQEALQANGYCVLEASNGNEAVKIAAKHAGVIDVMVTDVVMPQLGGRELAEKLSLTRPDMRVLYMSGYTDDAIVHHGVLDGRAAFLEKPFAPDALALKVREVLAVG